MLHTSTETSSNHWKPIYSGSTTGSQSLHPSIPKGIRLSVSDYPPSASHPYYQAYAPFPGPTPYQGYPNAGPQTYAPGWVQAAPQIEITIAPSSGVYSNGGYTYGVSKPPHSQTSSNSDPFYPRKRAPSDSDHSSNYSQHHAPYQHSRNPSSSSIGHVTILERPSIHLESDRSKAHSRELSSTIPPCFAKSSSNSSRHDSNFRSKSLGVKIAPLLSGRTSECPFIDWHLWDKMHSSAARDANGQFCATDMELDAFTPQVREPVFIKGIPGKSDGFSLAIQRWGAIRVSPRRPGSSITVNDIMLAISLWMMVPIQPEDWKIFDKIFEKHVSDAFESRKMYAKSHRPLTGSAKDRAQVVDSLFCRVRWDGLVISDDFPESKVVYLRLKDSSLRV